MKKMDPPPTDQGKERALLNPKVDWGLLKETYRAWNRHNASQLGAALAFYTTFSFAPILIIAIAIGSFVFSHEAVQVHVLAKVRDLAGQESAGAIQALIAGAHRPGAGAAATVVGVIIILTGATSALVMLRNALDAMWGVAPNPHAGMFRIIQARLVSLALVLGIGFILLLSMFAGIAITTLGHLMGQMLQIPNVLLQIANFIVSFGFITLLFAMFYKFLPDVKIAWRDVWVGSVMTALLFTLGNVLLGLYLARGSVRSAYGAAGSLVAFLLWVYYSAQIVLFGAEFTRVYASKGGIGIEPKRHAVWLPRDILGNRSKAQKSREDPSSKDT